MDTVLWVGLVFLLVVVSLLLTEGRIDRSTMPDRRQRLLNYTLPAGIAIHAIIIFRRHSATLMAASL